jgi:hypothetical protein
MLVLAHELEYSLHHPQLPLEAPAGEAETEMKAVLKLFP